MKVERNMLLLLMMKMLTDVAHISTIAEHQFNTGLFIIEVDPRCLKDVQSVHRRM